MRQTLRHQAAKIRPNLRVLFASLLLLSIFSPFANADSNNTPERREAAEAQFERAEKARQMLEARSESSRTLKEYRSLVIAYKRVYLITPHATDVSTALNQVAELYSTMGDLFDEKFYQSAIDAYRFLLREYPTSRYREEGLLAIAHIEQDDLHDAALAQKTYQEFLTLHPRSSHADEVHAILDKLSAGAQPTETVPRDVAVKGRTGRISPAPAASADKTPPTTDTGQEASADAPTRDGSVAEVSRIRTWNADTYTRIVIDVGSQVKYQAARISKPDRIYFDIEGAQLDSALLHKSIDVASGGFLKQVRVAQNQADVVRIVLDVNHVKDYSVFLLPDPYRLVVDVYGTSAAAEEAKRETAPVTGTNTERAPEKTRRPAKDTETVAKARPKTSHITESKTAAKKSARSSPAGDDDAAASRTSTLSTKKSSRAKKSAHDEAEEMGPPPTPELTRDGQHSLTRALGLKIGRIVIDPGHGGHDTGTIGPTGLMEKDLCLDVSLRLGRLIRQRLPGAEVIFTRKDDTYVPLERRTQIANEAHADLFLSVHANSSHDRKARGIETYYLNFTGSSDAMEVASRENALSDNSVHNLREIVSKIAKNEKIEESRDFAGIIQDSLTKRIEKINRGERNRGVRKAPFVVLIGANMPSVLAEISFISNPYDERWLKKAENRERVAEGLYRGIEQYLQSTNSLANNQVQPAPGQGNRSGIVARSGNSQ